MAFKN